MSNCKMGKYWLNRYSFHTSSNFIFDYTFFIIARFDKLLVGNQLVEDNNIAYQTYDSDIKIIFTSDSSKTDKGFKLSYTTGGIRGKTAH